MSEQTDWQDISTAPRDGNIIRLKSASYSPVEAFFWNSHLKRWESKVPTFVGWITAWWDESLEQPTHWQPLPSPAKILSTRF